MKKQYLLFLFGFLISFSAFGQNEKIHHVPPSKQTLKYPANGATPDHPEELEHVYNFHSDVVVNKDGSLVVTENIRVFVKDKKYEDGFFRTLSASKILNGKRKRLKYEILSVKRDRENIKYQKKRKGKSHYIYYLKNKKETLSPGLYDYILEYKVGNQFDYYDDYDQLVWNVNGTEWPSIIDTVSTTIRFPEDSKILRTVCYTANHQETQSNCGISKPENNEISAEGYYFSDSWLIVFTDLPKGIIFPPAESSFWSKYWLAILSVFILLLSLLILLYDWYKIGQDSKYSPPAIPQLNPPDDLSSAAVGYIKTREYNSKQLTSLIVSLATKGFLQIQEEEVKSTSFPCEKSIIYKITTIKKDSDSLNEEEKLVYERLSGLTSDELILDGNHNLVFELIEKELSKKLNSKYYDILQKGAHFYRWVIPYLMLFFVYFFLLKIGEYYYVFDESSAVKREIDLLVYVIFLLFNPFFFLRFVKISNHVRFWINVGYTVIFLIINTRNLFFMDSSINELAFYIFGSSIIFIIPWYNYLIERPSRKRIELETRIKGLEMYLSMAETRRIKAFNPPETTPEEFERMLPYAIALRVDKIWGEKFSGYIKSSSEKYDLQSKYHWYERDQKPGFENYIEHLNAYLSSNKPEK